MAMKYWNFPKQNQKQAEILAKECEISPFVAEILINRNMTSYLQIQDFLNQEIAFESPFVLADMDQAVKRIQTAIDNCERIAIYGDYDCDGVTSTVILYSYLTCLGADVIYYIPSRSHEGYGLNQTAIQSLSQQQISLIITVDNGISAIEEVQYSNQLGMDIIITDHHQVGEKLPEAYAVINPHRKDCPSKFKYLAGVGVVFKLIAAMEGGDYHSILEQFGDIVAVGTVGDIVPLIGENRALVNYGLNLLAHTDNLGLYELMKIAAVHSHTPTSQDIGFGIVPRINAAGRMGNALLAVRLLLSDTQTEAAELAQELNTFNLLRKEQENGILTDIQRQISENPEKMYDRVLTFYQQDWHHGVIGIVSSKVLEFYGKPNLLMSLDKDGVLTGSGRSVEFFPLHQLLTACESELLRYGGHKQAAGFSLKLERFERFKQLVEQYAAKHFLVMPNFSYHIDKQLYADDLTLENIRALSLLEPFGAENQQPLFLLSKAVIKQITPISENKHLRLKLQFGSLEISAMCFRTSTKDFLYTVEDKVDFLANISLNYYKNREYLSIVVKDIRPSEFVQDQFFYAKGYYEMFRRKEPIKKAILDKIIPNRDEVAIVYRYLKKHHGFQNDIDLLFSILISTGMNYCKFRLILDILSDVNLISISPLLNEIQLCVTDKKVDLQTANTMQQLISRQAQCC